jgi:hypothetical protein
LAIAMTIAPAIIDDRYYPENRYYDDEEEHHYPDRYHHRRPPPSRYRGYDQWDEDPGTAHPVGAGQADPARGLRGALLFPATRTGCAGQGRADLVVQGVEATAGFCLRFRMQRRLQFLNTLRS